MYFILDDLEIQNKHVNSVFFGHDQTMHFSGRALEEDGKKIGDRLSRFKKGQIVEVVADTSSYRHYEGICEIIEIEFPPPTIDKAPAIYRFRGKLKPVY